MTNKEKYPKAKIDHFQPYGFYIYLGNSTYLVDGEPSPNLEGWKTKKGRYYHYQTKKEAQKALDQFMKPVKKKPNTLDEIKSQLEKAKQLIGKRIKVLVSGTNVVGNIALVKDVQLLLEKQNTWSDIAVKCFKQNGYVIVLTTDYGKTLFDPTCYELVKEVVVNNHLGQEYVAQDCGRFWKFGCAEISKQQIKDLYNIMSSKNYGGNRTVSKVTIGAADFSLDTLKALVDNG